MLSGISYKSQSDVWCHINKLLFNSLTCVFDQSPLIYHMNKFLVYGRKTNQLTDHIIRYIFLINTIVNLVDNFPIIAEAE